MTQELTKKLVLILEELRLLEQTLAEGQMSVRQLVGSPLGRLTADQQYDLLEQLRDARAMADTVCETLEGWEVE